MAEEKKDPPKTIGTATTIRDWVTAYYGDDAIDYSKKNKVRHTIRVCQFSSIVAIVTKNSKQAHTDFFESAYTAVDTTYVKAAELIMRLMELKWRENRPLTRDDFENCGGKAMFDGRPNYDKIVSDYIGSGGMVEMCECVFPTPSISNKKGNDDLRSEKESFKQYYAWLQSSTEDERKARALQKRQMMYSSMIADLNDVKSDHAQLLAIASEGEQKDGALNGKSLHEIYNATTDKASNMYREHKDKRSKIDFTIKDDVEKAVSLRYESAKQTAKVAALGGVATASLGAVIGGVFWPAILLIPTYAIAKKWIPDWAKSLGAQWGHFEQSIGHRFQRQKYAAYLKYMVSFMETGGKPKLSLKDRLFLRPDIIKALKKGSKSGSVGATFEGSDEITHKSELDRAKETTSLAFGNYRKADDKAVPIDKKTELNGKVEAIAPDAATFEQFVQLANRYKEYQADLDSDTKLGFQIKYAKKLEESLVSLIFNDKLESMTQFQDNISPWLSEDSLLFEVIKDVAEGPGIIAKAKRLKFFASKELSGLDFEKCKDMTLAEYISRPGLERLSDEKLAGMKFDSSTRTWGGGFINPTDTNLVAAISYIRNLERHPSDERLVVSTGGVTLEKINETIMKIVNKDDKNICDSLLKEQMKTVFYNAAREDSQKAFKAVTTGAFGGKLVDMQKINDMLSEMSYENVGSEKYAGLVYDLTGESRISPQAMGRYLRGKIGKAAYDVFSKYLNDDKKQEFKKNLPLISDYLKKVNSSGLLNEQQKADLSSQVTKFIGEAYINRIQELGETFLANENGYNLTEFTDYLKSYQKGGFSELFESDQSSETQGIKAGIEYMIEFAGIHSGLKFNKEFSIPQVESKYISKTLLLDRSSGGKKPIIRDYDDDLRKIVNQIKNINISFSADLNPANLSSETAYGQISEALKDIVGRPDARNPRVLVGGMGNSTDAEKHDKYTALLILKNKTIVLFRKYMRQFISEKYGVSGDTDSEQRWLTRNMPLVNSVKTEWKNLLDQIDEALFSAEFDRLPGKVLASKASDELGKYGDAQSALTAVKETELGG